jgi:hypothetical protein
MKAHTGAVKAYLGAVVARLGGLEAHPGVVMVNLDSERLILKTWRPRAQKSHPGVLEIHLVEAHPGGHIGAAVWRCGQSSCGHGAHPKIMEINLESKKLIL